MTKWAFVVSVFAVVLFGYNVQAAPYLYNDPFIGNNTYNYYYECPNCQKCQPCEAAKKATVVKKKATPKKKVIKRRRL